MLFHRTTCALSRSERRSRFGFSWSLGISSFVIDWCPLGLTKEGFFTGRIRYWLPLCDRVTMVLFAPIENTSRKHSNEKVTMMRTYSRRSSFRFVCRLIAIPTLLACAWGLSSQASVLAGGPRVLLEGQLPSDQRLEPLKDLNGYFPFEPPKARDAWQHRSAELRRRILVATGLWPMPKPTPANAVVFGRVDRHGFTVEKVYFESYPNHFVTGLLFRPKESGGRRPGVLCPHGHGGRLQDYGAKNIRQLLVQGAERFEGSGRYPKLARCAQLARMGCVVFIFDMVGYADSTQISRELAHGFKKQRPEFDTKKSWGFFSTQAELRLQSIMGLQTYNSIRALDFLASLPDVDPQRLGVTGGSGGGTQTILLGAIDPRPVVAFPQGMVSTSMQGGCTCENCTLLRIGTGNVELAALFAPRPQGMTAANDWTKEMMTKGFPQLQQLYAMLGAKQNVFCQSQLHFPHNYNYVTRALMYGLFNKHLKLGLEEPIVEEDYRPLTAEEWTVWDDEHPRPSGGPEYERSLMKWLDDASARQITALVPQDDQSLGKYREVIGGAVQTIVGRTLPESGTLERKASKTADRGDYIELTCLVRLKKYGEELPVVSLYPKAVKWNKQVVIWVDGAGKSALFDAKGAPCPEVQSLLAAGTAVISADLLCQGEFLADGKPVTRTRTVKNPREFAGYSFGYNHTLFAHRVHDIMTLIALARTGEHQAESVHLLGVAGAGPWVAAAAALVDEPIDRVALDTEEFRFVDLKSYRDVNFLPGIVKYGDLPALLALVVPHPLWLAGENGVAPKTTAAAYRAAGEADRIHAYRGDSNNTIAAAIAWLQEE